MRTPRCAGALCWAPSRPQAWCGQGLSILASVSGACIPAEPAAGALAAARGGARRTCGGSIGPNRGTCRADANPHRGHKLARLRPLPPHTTLRPPFPHKLTGRHHLCSGGPLQALPASEALAQPLPAAPAARRPNELAQPASARHRAVVLAEVADAAAADLSALCDQLCAPKALGEYPTSVKVLLRELRDKTDELRRMRFELAATQKLLYASQETVENVQAAKWKELGMVATSCMGLAASLHTYLGASVGQVGRPMEWPAGGASCVLAPPFHALSCSAPAPAGAWLASTADAECPFACCLSLWLQIEAEKKRALVNVEVQVQQRLQGALAEEVEERVAVRLADAVEQVGGGLWSRVLPHTCI